MSLIAWLVRLSRRPYKGLCRYTNYSLSGEGGTSGVTGSNTFGVASATAYLTKFIQNLNRCFYIHCMHYTVHKYAGILSKFVYTVSVFMFLCSFMTGSWWQKANKLLLNQGCANSKKSVCHSIAISYANLTKSIHCVVRQEKFKLKLQVLLNIHTFPVNRAMHGWNMRSHLCLSIHTRCHTTCDVSKVNSDKVRSQTCCSHFSDACMYRMLVP